ncbi:L-2-amino-thiazoline-4-carboxylic acid hydrolase [Amycolatopsis magusensis]|uniref:L-2-amino-thiazoline-4-carboxylic acid hydrolase n=1 Tax=Amycolatopsis magusensis TaxID=882444 RepID=UPI003C2F7121
MTDLNDPRSWFVEPFFAALLDGVPDAAEVRARLERETEDLLDQTEDLVVDEAARSHVVLTAYAVAAYRWLQGRVADPLDAVREAVVGPFGEWMADTVRAELDQAPDPFAAMVANLREQEKSFYGKGFAWERVVDDDRAILSRAHRCVYHDASTRLGAPELTAAVWCEWDKPMLAAVDPDRHGMRAARPVTIGYGCDHCDFAFERTT